MSISPARVAAFDILRRVGRGDAYSSALLPVFEARLAPVDRPLCHELTMGTLRRQKLLDALIDYYSAGKKLDIEVRIALRLGLYQLKFLERVPDHAAINDSVDLTVRAGKTSAKGFVNAILRRGAREGPIRLSFMNDGERISVETSHPIWLIDKWTADHGLERAERIAKANNEVPAIAFRLTCKADRGALSPAVKARASALVEGCFIADSLDPEIMELSDKGVIYLQDQASQMVAQTIAVPPGGRFLDLCAAPGGKTGSIACRADGAGLLAAGDIHGPRVQFLAENLKRQGAGFVSVVRYNAEMPLPFAEESFDAILVDAPCSGTGTLRHNPEIRYKLAPGDIADMAEKQLSILGSAARLVRPGGILTYSTCSLEPEENENVAARFLGENPAFEVYPPNVCEQFLTQQGFARTWPDRDGIDGFFIGQFRRGLRSNGFSRNQIGMQRTQVLKFLVFQ